MQKYISQLFSTTQNTWVRLTYKEKDLLLLMVLKLQSKIAWCRFWWESGSKCTFPYLCWFSPSPWKSNKMQWQSLYPNDLILSLSKGLTVRIIFKLSFYSLNTTNVRLWQLNSCISLGGTAGRGANQIQAIVLGKKELASPILGNQHWAFRLSYYMDISLPVSTKLNLVGKGTEFTNIKHLLWTKHGAEQL